MNWYHRATLGVALVCLFSVMMNAFSIINGKPFSLDWNLGVPTFIFILSLLSFIWLPDKDD